MNDINQQPAESKDKHNSLEKFREQWLRHLVLHRGINGSTLRVAIVLAYHINRKTGLAFPGMRTIRKLTGLSTSTISQAVNWLDAYGYLHIERGRTRNATNRYRPTLVTKSKHLVRTERTPAFGRGDTDLPTYLPKEPLSYKASIDIDVSNKGSTEEEKKGTSEIASELRDPASIKSPSLAESPQSDKREAYLLARQHYNLRGVSLVAKAFKEGRSESEVLDIVAECVEAGGDVDELAHGLWLPN